MKNKIDRVWSQIFMQTPEIVEIKEDELGSYCTPPNNKVYLRMNQDAWENVCKRKRENKSPMTKLHDEVVELKTEVVTLKHQCEMWENTCNMFKGMLEDQLKRNNDLEEHGPDIPLAMKGKVFLERNVRKAKEARKRCLDERWGKNKTLVFDGVRANELLDEVVNDFFGEK